MDKYAGSYLDQPEHLMVGEDLQTMLDIMSADEMTPAPAVSSMSTLQELCSIKHPIVVLLTRCLVFGPMSCCTAGI